MRYLDPKADLTFKKVFGEHKDIVTSFLNAMLPLGEDEQIVEIEYQTSELVPTNPRYKNSVVDVSCVDNNGRQFLVEMQFAWSREFYSRVVFNASKAYVRQSERGYMYKDLKTVYSLNLVNTTIEPELEGYYHHYRIVHMQHSEKVIEGLQFIFVELPKFSPTILNDKKMQVLWLRFLTEINEETKSVPGEMFDVPELKKAITTVEEAALSDRERYSYDKFWDMISVERTLFDEAHDNGLAEGLEQGLEQGREQGLEQGRIDTITKVAKSMKDKDMPLELIAETLGLTVEEIEKL